MEKIIVIDGEGDGDWVISMDELEARGRELLVESPMRSTSGSTPSPPNDWPPFIYTSGTTGKPKGVRLEHGSWTYTAAMDSPPVAHRQGSQLPVAAAVTPSAR